MSMMNDYDEDLDGFPPENKEQPAESTIGAYRAEPTDVCTKWNHIEDSTAL